MKRLAAIALLAIAACPVALAQGDGLAALRAALPAPGQQAPADPRGADLAARAFAIVGREDLAAEARRRAGGCVTFCTLAPDEDVMAALVARIGDARIVIVNESRDRPDHRAFVEDLAAALRQRLAYSHFAVEALYEDDDRIGAPRMGDGAYSNEPQFGALLRRAASLGFTITGFEQGPIEDGRNFVEAVNAAEAARVESLVRQIFAKAPDARVLIHVSGARNSEAPEPVSRRQSINWFARQLGDRLGQNPVTIDQTKFTADRRALCAAAADGGALPAGQDLHVAHPPLAFDRNRPTWRRERGALAVDPPASLAQTSARTIYEARLARDPADAIPADRILVEPGEQIPLLLFPGRYLVRAWTASGGWSEAQPLTVAAPLTAQKQNRTRRRK